MLRLRNVGIPTVGFTWYSLTDQVDWDTALREQNGNVNPLGLLRSRPQHPQRRQGLQAADHRLARRAAGVQPVPVVPIVPPAHTDRPLRAGARARQRPSISKRLRHRARQSGEPRHEDRPDRDLLRAAALAVRPGRERRRRGRLGRGEPRGPCRGGGRRLRGASRPLPRPRPLPDRGHLADRLSRRLLPRRAGADVGARRARAGAVGPEGQGARPAGLGDARRPGPRPDPRLCLDRRRPAGRDRRGRRGAPRRRASPRSR